MNPFTALKNLSPFHLTFLFFCLTFIYDYIPSSMRSTSIHLCRSLTRWVRHFLPRDFEYCSLSGNLQRNCGFNLMTTSSETAIFNRMEPHATPRMRAWPKSKAFFWWPDYIKSLMAAKISWLKSARFFPVERLKRKSLCQQATHHTGIENNIRREIAAISEDVLQATLANTKLCVQLCLDSGDEHFQHLLYYQHVSHEERYVVIYACSKSNDYSLRYSHFLGSSTERITLYITFVEFQDSKKQNQPEHLSR